MMRRVPSAEDRRHDSRYFDHSDPSLYIYSSTTGESSTFVPGLPLCRMWSRKPKSKKKNGNRTTKIRIDRVRSFVDVTLGETSGFGIIAVCAEFDYNISLK